MDHEQSARILPDYVEGAIDAGDADAVERHLASCGECRESVSMLRRIAKEIRVMGAAAFDDHPETAHLVDYSLVPRHLADADFARIEQHVKSCPTCAHEVDAVRSGDSWSRSWSHGIAESLRAGIAPAPVPALATAFVALLLVYPAYLGLVRLPEVDRERAGAIEALARREAPPRGGQHVAGEAPAWTGGPSATLWLAAPSRGAGSSPRTGVSPDASGRDPGGAEPSIPTVHLRPHQAFLPIRIDLDISDWAAEQPVVVTVREFNSPRQLWRHSGSAAQIWDPADEAINLLLPADALDAGTYTLEITKEGSPAAAYSASFAIEE